MGEKIPLEKHLRLLEEELLKPDVRASAERLDELLADDFFEFASSGQEYNKQEIIKSLQVESEKRMVLYDFRTRLLSSEVALVTYRVARYTTGQKESQHSLRSSIWRLMAGRWQMIFHQGTPTELE